MKHMCAVTGCRKTADRKLGRRYLCSDHEKELRRPGVYGTKKRATRVFVERIISPKDHGLANFPFQVYRDTAVSIH